VSKVLRSRGARFAGAHCPGQCGRAVVGSLRFGHVGFATAGGELVSISKSGFLTFELRDQTLADGGALVTSTVTNPSDAPVDFYRVSCLLLSADGTVVAPVSAFPDSVAPGQTITREAAGFSIEPAVAAGATVAECRSFATIS